MTIGFLAVLLLNQGDSMAETTMLPPPDMLAVQGRWIRSDAPYVIELGSAKNGELQATYYNPRPINVAATKCSEQNGSLRVLIQLQDVNYNGSIYYLTYDRSPDSLQGIFLHAASRKSFEVNFVRQNSK